MSIRPAKSFECEITDTKKVVEKEQLKTLSTVFKFSNDTFSDVRFLIVSAKF